MSTSAVPPAQPAGWPAVLERQDGVIGRRQARLGGLTEDAWQWRLDTGRWTSVLPGVAVAHSGEVTARERSWAAVVYAGDGAALSADAALVERGMRLPELSVVHVAVPESRRVAPQRFAGSDVRLEPHRVRRLDALVHPVLAPRSVRVAAAVLHAAAWAGSDRDGEWRLAAAVQQRVVRPTDLRTALRGLACLPRSALIGTVLDDVEQGAHAASELAFLRFLREHGLPPPDRLQRPVRRGTVHYLDAWWERQRVTVEVDGAHHRLVGSWEADMLRGNDVVLGGRQDRLLLALHDREPPARGPPRGGPARRGPALSPGGRGPGGVRNSPSTRVLGELRTPGGAGRGVPVRRGTTPGRPWCP